MYYKQQGFTLYQSIITLAVITAVSAATVGVYHTSKQKSSVLLATMQDVGAGLMRMKEDIHCYPKRLDALMTPAQAKESYCGPIAVDNWRGAYVNQGSADDNGDLQLEGFGDNVKLQLIREEFISPAGQTRMRWVLQTANLVPELSQQVSELCGSKTDATRCGVSAETRQARWIVEDTVAPVATNGLVLDKPVVVNTTTPPITPAAVSIAPVGYIKYIPPPYCAKCEELKKNPPPPPPVTNTSSQEPEPTPAPSSKPTGPVAPPAGSAPPLAGSPPPFYCYNGTGL